MLIVRYLRIAVAGALAAATLTACGLTKSPAEGLTFTAPSGWTGTPGIMGRFQLWTGTGDASGHVLMLMKLPADTNLKADFDMDNLKDVNGSASLKDAKILARRTMTLCNGQQSMFMKMQGKSKNQNTEESIEAVLSKASDGTYMAMYMYPIGAATNPAAEAAIYELCPAK
jgi:hypothetical protein